MKNPDETVWFEIQLVGAMERQEIILSKLFELGAAGVFEHDDIASLYFSGRSLSDATKEAVSYLKSLDQIKYRVLPLQNKDWSLKFRQDFRAQPIAGSFYLVPAWDRKNADPGERFPIVMEAGQAFGTGLHPSTRLTIGALESVVSLFKDRSAIRVLDVGTGTGILAIAAEKLGVSSIVAIDIDATAVSVATENGRNNECNRISFSTTPIDKLPGPFEIILSNILLETHLELATQYSRLLSPGGILILSGLLGNQRAEVEMSAGRQGLTVSASRNFQEWMALEVIHRPGLK